MEEKIVYFEQKGKENTGAVLRIALEAARARGIKKIVLASTRGNAARAAMEALRGTGIQLIVVPWQYGFGDPHGMGEQPFPAELAAELSEQGHRVHFGTLLFHTDELYGTGTPRALANMLRIFCQGMKVCVEILMMAADGGCIASGEKVIAVAGTGAGADTAVIALAAPSNKLKDLHIQEILCKPL